MMLKRLNFFAIVILMITMGLRVNGKEHESPVYTQYVAEVISSFVKEMYKEYGFESGASGGEMPYDVEEISVSLTAYRSATIEQARELEVNATEKFVEIVNAHKKIRPFLREYPFPPSRASISISFRDPKKVKTSSISNDVLFVFQTRNRIFYRAKNPDNLYVPKPIGDEPYEEARKIVRNNAAKNDAQKS
jgi:hypothetical protein